MLHPVGLLPRQGFYHQTHGRHATLASDLMEPFRHSVERTALTVLLRKELTPWDFSYTPAGACRIENQARRKFLPLLLQR
ncbi:MAG: CRISPR-associated endonuclease Cas1 [Methylococcales bacterium]